MVCNVEIKLLGLITVLSLLLPPIDLRFNKRSVAAGASFDHFSDAKLVS